MSTRRVVLVSLLVASACVGLAAAYADGSWRDLWLNLLAAAVGVAFILLFVDVLFERSEARARWPEAGGSPRARVDAPPAASWLVAMFMAPGATSRTQVRMICPPA